MINKIKPSNCERCVHFARLTPAESAIIQPKLIQTGIATGTCLGACFHLIRKPHLLIRRFIFGREENCEFFVQGFHRELLGIKCPGCKQGELSISRPSIQGKTVILLGCNRYPDCRFSAKQISLPTRCRFCNIPLILSGGDSLKCSCSRCKKGVQIPLSLKIWPNLAQPNGGCVHLEPIPNCPSCSESRKRQTNLLDLELPILANWIKECREEERDPYQITNPVHDRIMEDYWLSWDAKVPPDGPVYPSEERSREIHRYYYGGPPEEASEPKNDDAISNSEWLKELEDGFEI